MITLFEKLKNNIDRNLKEADVSLRVYSVVFVFSVVAFGFMGIGKIYPLIRAKMRLLNEMDVTNQALQTNLTQLQQANSDLNNSRVSLAYLDKYLPVETDTQSYMLDFIQAASEAGFWVKSFSQNSSETQEGQLNLNISLESDTYPTNLIQQIEVLKRITQVKSVGFSDTAESGKYSINLIVTIYTLLK